MRLLSLVLLVLALPIRAADPPADKDAFYNWLQAQAKKQFDARRQAVASLKTPDDVRKRQETLRKHFLAALGDLPARTPLNGKVVGRKQYDGYVLERIIYESRPDHHVTANFYIPDGKGP